ncbi:DNA-binding protein [Candidatus Symbiopectobacterium sp. 'North America']|uniref:helix-turn-helix domain-containing protein n=1 Tax=Candidatus Symbiopectobacterium sp. 'North America' TaxID=2794574 RepID=UPI0018CAB44B|nr:helix-turn-helix transcriptional regulator [Candidatus Symbiopectobacterium sp. 'North America']MBG6244770.1 DNA-binding protein [Candidatus Symbiopectobacterium sp. 'North America']
MSNEEIGLRVKQVRAGSGLNQRDFAAKQGISNGGISQIESGKTVPGGDFLLRIHQEFSVDLTWLLSGLSNSEFSPLSRCQSALLNNYDHLSESDKAALERTAFALAEQGRVSQKVKTA